MKNQNHLTWAEVDLDAIAHNARGLKERAGEETELMAVVKANAYGHGAVPVARTALENGASRLAVNRALEGVELRQAGITAPILILGYSLPNEAETIVRWDLTPTVTTVEGALALSAMSDRQGKVTPIHIKVDTGMGRIGFDINRAMKEIPRIARLRNIKLEGLLSHFSEADLKDKHFANLQLNNFLTLTRALNKKNITFQCLHIANSAAVLSMPDAHLNMVRPGIMLYGYGYSDIDKLKPVLSLKSKILYIKKVPPGTPVSYGRTFTTKRKSIIATIPLGYADGYSRKLSNNGEVLISGKRAPIVGRVCMDTIMVDVTDLPNVSYKNEVVLIGRQGREQITADDIADKTGTIPYEVLTSIGQRIKRVYK